MSTHDDDQTGGRPPVIERVAAALDALTADYLALPEDAAAGPMAQAARADRMAMISARRAAWWRLLLRRGPVVTTPPLYARAVVAAVGLERSNVRFWRDTAADWRAIAERRPTSDVAGAMSNHRDLGIAS